MEQKLREIGKAFQIDGDFYAFSVITQGNINSTYRVIYHLDDGSMKAYVFQKINTYVFKKPEEIMSNIEKVTRHIINKHPNDVCVHFHYTREGKNFIYDSDAGSGGSWTTSTA